MNARARLAVAIVCLVLAPACLFAGEDEVQVRVVLADAAAGAMDRIASTYGGEVRSTESETTAIVTVPASRQSLLSRDPRVQSAKRLLASNGWSEGMAYTYDAAGNVTQIGSGSSADVFIYDSADRLVKGKVAGKERQYTYDAFGNRTGCTDIASGGSSCQPVTIVSASNRVQTATYDAAGSVTQFGSKSYTYDSVGMLKRDTQVLPAREYLYTADDERLAVIVGSTWNWTIRDLSGKVLREFTSNGSSSFQWTRDNIWRNGQLLSSLQPSGSSAVVWHYHLDHLGTPRLVTDTTGTILGVHDYHAFGTEIAGNAKESPESRFKFTSHERDSFGNPAEPLDYMHARYYQAGWGRFLSVDPTWASADLSRPQSWNRYSYVMNNPVNMVDPDGRATKPYEAAAQVAESGSEAYDNLLVVAVCPQCGMLGSTLGLLARTLRLGDKTGDALGSNASTEDTAVAVAEDVGTASQAILTMAGGAAVARSTASVPSTVQANKAAGDAFRDQVAAGLRAEGRQVTTEVVKKTPFGPRRVDIEVADANGKVLGGVETKVGSSRYIPSQRAKDTWLKLVERYIVNLVRDH